MNFQRKLLTAGLLAALAPAAQAEVFIDVIGDYEVSLEGLFQADGNWFDNDVVDLNGPGTGSGANGDDSEFELRRAEVILKGKGVSFDWVIGYDAKADKFLDTNLKWKLGSSYLIAGQYKQANSLEELSSTRFNDFISKAMVTNLFGIARRTAIGYGRDEPNWGYQINAFGRELTRNLAHGRGYGARAYYAPIMDGGHILHFGLSANQYDTDNDNARLRVRPDADLALNRLIDTGTFVNAEDQTTLGAEAMWINGPFKLSGEYMRSTIDRYQTARASQPGRDFTGDSWYAAGVWNISGETWTYKSGVPVTMLPDDPAKGMWQLGLRYDRSDLNDGLVTGGKEDNWTVGVNWYWRSNFKFALNWVKVDSSKFISPAIGVRDDDPSILEARAQFYW